MYSTDANFNGANSSIERNTVQNQSPCCGGVYVTGLANSRRSRELHQPYRFLGVFLLQRMVKGGPPTPPLVNLTVSNNVIDGTNITSDWWWFKWGPFRRRR